MSETVEEWVDVPTFVGRYKVSNLGRVKSLARKNRFEDRILSLSKREGRSPVVSLCGKRKKQIQVSRLVLWAFRGERKRKLVIRHKDGDYQNNALSNLEWASRSEMTRPRCGETHPNAKLTREQVEAIREDDRLGFVIAKEYGINPVTVSRIKNRKRWAHV